MPTDSRRATTVARSAPDRFRRITLGAASLFAAIRVSASAMPNHWIKLSTSQRGWDSDTARYSIGSRSRAGIATAPRAALRRIALTRPEALRVPDDWRAISTAVLTAA